MKVGVTLPISEQPGAGVRRYREIRDLALRAEDAGLDSVWLFDHLYAGAGSRDAGIWEAWTFLTALAEATTRVELGTIVLCTAFRNPALLAKMADALQEVSDGRLILGVGAGWNQLEFEDFGFPFDHLASRFEEAIQIIASLVRTGEADFTGTYERAPGARSIPRGPKVPPILSGARQPRMIELTARYADAWNVAWLGWPEDALAPRVAALHEACERVGRDPAEIELTVGVLLGFRDLGYPGEPDRATHITGGADEIAEAFRAHEAAGVGHLIVQPTPWVPEALARLAAAHQVYLNG